MFLRRVSSAALLIGVLIVAVIFCRSAGAVLVFIVGNMLGLMSVLEYFRMLEAKGMRIHKFYGASATVIFISTVFFHSFLAHTNNGMEYLTMVALITGLFIVQAFDREPGKAIGNIAGVLSGFVYIAWLWSFIFKVMYFPGLDGRWYVFALFLIVKGSDMLAYAIGSTFGTHKLIPRISPGKTWEGAGGSLAGGLIGGFIIWKWFPCGLTLPRALFMGGVLNLIGQVGDLSESMLKRDAGFKDSSGFIPGLGGALDVLDSLLLTLPVLYFYLVISG